MPVVAVVARRPVYPRWRGEHTSRNIDKTPGSGLSPLARGTRYNIYLHITCGRFIPAGAGNTSYDNPESTKNAVYPRWRGEHYNAQAGEGADDGLSPLARGTRLALVLDAKRRRFIPAGAGNTFIGYFRPLF